MRISIWQQFSSNHSSSFTVVGEFQTVAAAQRAADELRRILQTVVDWYIAHPEAEELWASEGICPPTPPENQFAEHYHVVLNQEYGIDWIGRQTDVSDAVTNLDRLVFVTHPINTWHGAYPFDSIVEKLGGQVMVNGQVDDGPDHEKPSSTLWIEQLTCVAPDEATAYAITDEISQYQELDTKAWQSAGQIPIPDAPWQPPGRPWYVSNSSGRGKVEYDGRQLQFEGWWFHKIAYGFPAFVAYLKKRGCTDIQYRLASEIDQDD